MMMGKKYCSHFKSDFPIIPLNVASCRSFSTNDPVSIREVRVFLTVSSASESASNEKKLFILSHPYKLHTADEFQNVLAEICKLSINENVLIIETRTM